MKSLILILIIMLNMLNYSMMTFNKTIESQNLQISKNNFNDNNEKIITSLDFIEAHNQLYRNGSSSHRLTTNQFTGMKNEDLPKMRFKNMNEKINDQNSGSDVISTQLLPEQFDWRQMGKVSKAKDQLGCNCCYAFTVIATIESVVAIRDGLTLDTFGEESPLDLSEQQIVDCSHNKGCNYGYIDDSYQYVIENGILSEKDYPYKHEKNVCKRVMSKKRTTIANFREMWTQSSEQVKHIIMQNGPVITPINNDGLDFLYYDQGIIRTEEKKFSLKTRDEFFNHAVVIVGWGQQNHTQYWIIKNSWSENWGESGFARIQFEVRGIAKYIYYPIIVDINQVIYKRILIFVFVILAILVFVSLLAVFIFYHERRPRPFLYHKIKT